jgi:acetoin utilization protein AcuB
MFISQSMTQKVITIDKEVDILEAKAIMTKCRFRHLPITGESGQLIGIVTDRDIRSALSLEEYRRSDWTPPSAQRKAEVSVKEIMTKDPVTISSSSTIQDALLLVARTRVGAFPVVDENKRVIGIISDRDLLRAFINVLGINDPGTLIGIVVDESIGEMEKVVRAITEENILFGSILVARNWAAGKRAVFPYLFTQNVTRLKGKLSGLGFELLDPMQWYIDQQE